MGGAERLLLTILSRLDRASFQPILICPELGPLQDKVAELGVPTATAAVLNARFTWRADYVVRYLISFVRVILDFRRKVVSINPDLIYANSVRAGLVATAATLGLGNRVIWHIHDLLPRHPFNPLIRTIALLSSRTRMIAVAEASADRFSGSLLPLRRRVTVIPNGVDLEEFHPNQIVKQKIRREWHLDDEAPVIGIVARITPSKGQLELLRVFARVLREFPTATLVIAGAPAFNREHEYLDLLKRTATELGISNRVRMLGARNDVAAIMQALDLLVLNSTVEACCLVALEAMACGIAVLATNTGGTPEIIEHGRNGWMVPLRNDDALTAGIVKLIEEPALRAQLAENGREHVKSRFSIDRYMTKVQTFCLEKDISDSQALYRDGFPGGISPQHESRQRV